VKQIKKML